MKSTNAPTTSSVTPFQFENKPVSIVMDEQGCPWFNAIEVCNALGYVNPRLAVSGHVDEDDVSKRYAIDALGRKQPTNHVNESGLYALIFGSTKPEAKRFKRWVTSEVLPTIRKTGTYTALTPPTPAQPPIIGLSYRECAAVLGVSAVTIYRYVRDGNIQPEPGGGVDLEKVREVGHQVWDRYGHYGRQIGIPRPGCVVGKTVPVKTQPIAIVSRDNLAARIERLESILEGQILPASDSNPISEINYSLKTALPPDGDNWVTYLNTVGNEQWKDPVWDLLIKLEAAGHNVDGCKAALRIRDLLTADANRMARRECGKYPAILLSKATASGEYRIKEIGALGALTPKHR